MSGSRQRVRFCADVLEDALKVSEQILGYAPPESSANLQIAEVFTRWEHSLTCKPKTLKDYRHYIKCWLSWADSERLRLWADIRLEHL